MQARNRFTVLVIVAAASMLPMVAVAAGTPPTEVAVTAMPTEVVAAAQSGLASLIREHASVQPREAFAQPFVRQQVDEATLTLGRGFQVYTIAPERILKDRAGFSASCTPTDMWRFLVLDGERTVGLLTVAQVEGRWATVAFGGAQLAEEMQQVFATWTQETGYQIRFIRVYQATADFVEVSPGPGQAEFVPMTSGRIALNLDNRAFDPQQLLPERQVFPALVEQVATALGVEPELK
jgi:hypothetical protein